MSVQIIERKDGSLIFAATLNTFCKDHLEFVTKAFEKVSQPNDKMFVIPQSAGEIKWYPHRNASQQSPPAAPAEIQSENRPIQSDKPA